MTTFSPHAPSFHFGLLVWLAVSAATGQEFPLVHIRQASQSGKLIGLQKKQQLVFHTDGQQRVIPRANLVRFGHLPALPKSTCVVCTDGSLISVDLDKLTPESMSIRSSIWQPQSLSMEHVAGIVRTFPAQQKQRDELIPTLVSQKGNRDILRLENGDQIRGVFLSSRWLRRRSLRRLMVRLRLADSTTELNFDQISWIRFNPTLVRQLATNSERTLVGTRDGSQLNVKSWTTRGTMVELTLSCGLKLKLPKSKLSSSVVYIQPLGKHITYLSDLPPGGYRHIPFFNRAWKLGVDRCCSGDRLRDRKQRFLKGLGMHSYSLVTFSLDGRYKQFQAELAMDRSAGSQGSVVCMVLLNERKTGNTWRTSYTSPVIRGAQPARPIRLDVRGAQRMALIVNYADRGDQLDRVNWLDARLTR